jgi:SAM-dependent methyltransferase
MPFPDTPKSLRRTIKRLLPKAALQLFEERRQLVLSKKFDGAFVSQNPSEIFSTVYEQSIWGHKADGGFFSGNGSHTPEVVSPYVRAVCEFLASFAEPPSVVDLGCGDFNVGRQIRPLCGQYVACDVVPALIARNQRLFAEMQVDFRCVDIVGDELPDGRVAFLRQVLQHLRNDQILSVIQKLKKFNYLVLTEHLPMRDRFVPNREKPTGPGIRLGVRSGVVLTAPPFNLPFQSKLNVCAVVEQFSLISTTIYQLN